MDMTKQEVAVIKAAIKSQNKSKLIQPVLFAILIGALLAMLFGSLSGDEFAYLAWQKVLSVKVLVVTS